MLINCFLHAEIEANHDHELMPIAFPRSTIAVIRLGFRTVTTIGTHKNPNFAFFNLNSIHRAFFIFAQFTEFGLHLMLNCLELIQQHTSEIDQCSMINFLDCIPSSLCH
jgi:hypothetical protein